MLQYGVGGCMPSQHHVTCDVWFSNAISNLEKHNWEATLFAGLWSIWKVRNDFIFSDITSSQEEVAILKVLVGTEELKLWHDTAML